MMNTLILGDVKIGPAHIGKRKKPCLCVFKPGECEIFGSFINDDCANRFMIELAELVGARKMRVLNGDQFVNVTKMVGGNE